MVYGYIMLFTFWMKASHASKIKLTFKPYSTKGMGCEAPTFVRISILVKTVYYNWSSQRTPPPNLPCLYWASGPTPGAKRNNDLIALF